MLYLRRISLVVLGVLTLALVIEVACNLYDPPYRAEVQKILDAPTPTLSEAAREAYAFALSQSEDSWRTDFNGCSPDAGCLASDLNTPDNLAALDRERDRIQRYLKLMSFGEFASSFRPRGKDFFEPAHLPNPRVHLLYTLQLARWASQGGIERVWQELELSNRFYASVMLHGPLLWRMIGSIQMRRNAKFVESELLRSPSRRVPSAVIESFDVPDINDILGGGLAYETQAVAAMIDGLFGWRRIFMRPRETLNMHHEIVSQTMFTDCPEITDACVPASAYLRPNRVYGWLVNPAGRELIRIVSVGVGMRAKLSQRLDQILTIKDELRHRP